MLFLFLYAKTVCGGMEKREVHTMTFDFTTLKNNLDNKGYKVAVFDMGESALI